MGRLAFRGHSTRGAEIISILQMYGGENYYDALCDNPNVIYFIGEGQRIESNVLRKIAVEDFYIFTLDDYLKKYPIMVGEYVNVNLNNGFYSTDEVTKIIWGGKQNAPFYITKHGYARVIEDLEYIIPYEESSDTQSIQAMKIYKVTIKTYYFGTKYYELFVKADSEESMRRVVLDKIRHDEDAEILEFKEIDLESRTCCIL